MRRGLIVGASYLALLFGLAGVGIAHNGGVSYRSPAAVCFPAKKWAPAPDHRRPCVLIRVYEDGSFGYEVANASGKSRYSGSVGAQDR